MLHPKKLLFCFLLFLLVFPAFARNNSVITFGSDTLANGLTQDESILFNIINDMRMKNKLPSIPLSKDLCVVAQTHIADLIRWKPQDRGCSLHSWSGSGKWTSCCNTKELPGIQCMKSKPREITGYNGDGYELIYWGEENATPAEAAALWHDVDASAEMILSQAKWTNYNWKAMGVGIKGGYAVLWLGDTIGNKTNDKTAENVHVTKQAGAKDNTVSKPKISETKTTKSETRVEQKGATINHEIHSGDANGNGAKYYIIVGSFKTVEAAYSELQQIKLKGYPSSFILEGESNFRIALASYDSYEKATAVKKELTEAFPGIWIYRN